MHIEQVTIKNFRCFEHLRVKLNPDVNVFVGNNGSGKSALLDAIAASMYPYVNPKQPKGLVFHRKSSPPSETFNISKRDLPVSDKSAVSEDTNQMQFSVRVYNGPKFDVGFLQLPSEREDFPVSFHRTREVLDFLRRFRPELPGVDFPLTIFAYYHGSRNTERIESVERIPKQSTDRNHAFSNALHATSNFSDLANWFFSKEFQELGEVRSRRNIDFELLELKAVRRAISEIISPSSRIFFAHTGSSTELKAEWATSTGDIKELWFSQLSSGYRNLLALIMDFSRRLAQANPQMKNPLHSEAILLIDEIDLHLHPTWQQHIIPDLRRVFPNTQLIVTTHSPEVVSTVEQHQVFLLEDYKIRDCPAPTRGMKSSDVVRYVLGVEDLRPNTPEKQKLTQLFAAIDNGDIEAAKQFREELQGWESFDGDITRADMQIRRMERRASV